MSKPIATSLEKHRTRKGCVQLYLVDQLVQRDHLTSPLTHPNDLSAMKQVDELVDDHLDPVGIDSLGDSDRLETLHVAVMICTEHIDEV
ncbi:MAG: hypothetical protein ACRDYA_14250 [Egibacteraceae bacterium]